MFHFITEWGSAVCCHVWKHKHKRWKQLYLWWTCVWLLLLQSQPHTHTHTGFFCWLHWFWKWRWAKLNSLCFFYCFDWQNTHYLSHIAAQCWTVDHFNLFNMINGLLFLKTSKKMRKIQTIHCKLLDSFWRTASSRVDHRLYINMDGERCDITCWFYWSWFEAGLKLVRTFVSVLSHELQIISAGCCLSLSGKTAHYHRLKLILVYWTHWELATRSLVML